MRLQQKECRWHQEGLRKVSLPDLSQHWQWKIALNNQSKLSTKGFTNTFGCHNQSLWGLSCGWVRDSKVQWSKNQPAVDQLFGPWCCLNFQFFLDAERNLDESSNLDVTASQKNAGSVWVQWGQIFQKWVLGWSNQHSQTVVALNEFCEFEDVTLLGIVTSLHMSMLHKNWLCLFAPCATICLVATHCEIFLCEFSLWFCFSDVWSFCSCFFSQWNGKTQFHWDWNWNVLRLLDHKIGGDLVMAIDIHCPHCLLWTSDCTFVIMLVCVCVCVAPLWSTNHTTNEEKRRTTWIFWRTTGGRLFSKASGQPTTNNQQDNEKQEPPHHKNLPDFCGPPSTLSNTLVVVVVVIVVVAHEGHRQHREQQQRQQQH